MDLGLYPYQLTQYGHLYRQQHLIFFPYAFLKQGALKVLPILIDELFNSASSALQALNALTAVLITPGNLFTVPAIGNVKWSPTKPSPCILKNALNN